MAGAAAEEKGVATAAPHAPKTTAAPAAKASDEKKTITVTFEGKDIALHTKIVADAEEDERSPSLNLLRFIRSKYDG